MKVPAHFRGKPWRRFKKDGPAGRLVRKVCSAVLILEAAVLISRSGLGVFSVERTYEEWLSPVPSGLAGETDEGTLEKIFGIRLRLRDGAVEFYRQENLREMEE